MLKAFLRFFREVFNKPQGKPTRIKDLSHIKKWEGLRLKAYRDQAGVWTIGYGHTSGVRPGDRITEAEAEMFLRQDVRWVEEALNRYVKVDINQNQYDALASLMFNIGAGAFKNSTLLKKLNQKNYSEAAKQFMVWVKHTDPVTGRKVVNQGLRNRRKDELRKFLS